METDFETTRRAVRRAYELGRVRVSMARAAWIAAAAAAVALLAMGQRALVWLPVTWLLWTFIEWRGMWLLRGARHGLVAGLVMLVLPLSILRPCCRPDADMGTGTCCTMPGACAAAGALIGLSLALLVPRVPGKHRVTAAIGMVLGVGSVAAPRCGGLMFGEVTGMLGGLVAGVVAVNLARAWFDRENVEARS